MRRFVIGLGLTVVLLGCGTTAPSGEPVPLLTGEGKYGAVGCYTFEITTKLVADPEVGTRTSDSIPVKWRPGYTARRVSSGEVVVLNPDGMVVATTGRTYTIQGGYEDKDQTTALSVFYACADVTEVKT